MKPLLLVFAVAGALCAQTAAHAARKAAHPGGPSALDKKQFEFYVRHLFVWPPPIEVSISDPHPSPIPGFVEVRVRATRGQASQEEKFFVSKDGKQILRGAVYDVAKNPFHDQLAILKTEGHPSLGTAGAPVVIAEFSDFQCHFCKEESKVFRENLLKEYPTQVHFFFMDFPLDGPHPWARAGAIAGQCVYRADAPSFWDFHDWIFEHQEEITVDNLKDKVLDWAKAKNLDAPKIAGCIDTRASEAAVDATVAMGRALEVNSTPTTFINGRPMIGATPWPDLKSVIDFELQYQETARNAGENCGCDLGIRKLGVQ